MALLQSRLIIITRLSPRKTTRRRLQQAIILLLVAKQLLLLTNREVGQPLALVQVLVVDRHLLKEMGLLQAVAQALAQELERPQLVQQLAREQVPVQPRPHPQAEDLHLVVGQDPVQVSAP